MHSSSLSLHLGKYNSPTHVKERRPLSRHARAHFGALCCCVSIQCFDFTTAAMAVPNRGPELLAVNIAFVTTAVSACLLRCYVRLRMVKAFGLDDWLMVIATVSEALLFAKPIHHPPA